MSGFRTEAGAIAVVGTTAALDETAGRRTGPAASDGGEPRLTRHRIQAEAAVRVAVQPLSQWTKTSSLSGGGFYAWKAPAIPKSAALAVREGKDSASYLSHALPLRPVERLRRPEPRIVRATHRSEHRV